MMYSVRTPTSPQQCNKIQRLKKELKNTDEKILNKALDDYLFDTQISIWKRLGEQLVHHKISNVCCSNLPIKVVKYPFPDDDNYYWVICEDHFKDEIFHKNIKISMDIDPVKALALKL